MEQDFLQSYLEPPPDLWKQQPGVGEVFPVCRLKSGRPAAWRAQGYLIRKHKAGGGLATNPVTSNPGCWSWDQGASQLFQHLLPG